MKKATTLTPQRPTAADKVMTQPSIGSLLLTVTTIMIGAVITSAIVLVATAVIGEVSQKINTAAIDTFFDLIATLFFTMLYVIAAGTESVQTGLMIGLYAGAALGMVYLVFKWLSLQKGWQLTPTWRRHP